MEPQHLLPHRVFGLQVKLDQVQGFRWETLIESSPPEGLPSPQLLNCDPNYTLPKLSPFPPRFLSRELQGKKIVVKIKFSGHTLDSQPSSSSPSASPHFRPVGTDVTNSQNHGLLRLPAHPLSHHQFQRMTLI